MRISDWSSDVCSSDLRGGFWFTDFGRDRGRVRTRGSVYYAKADGSAITEMIFPMEGPNGIGLSPDGSTLYVAETYSAHLWRFRLTAPGVIDRTAGMDAHGGTLVGRGGPGQFLDSIAVGRGRYICVPSSGGGLTLVFPPGGGQ